MWRRFRRSLSGASRDQPKSKTIEGNSLHESQFHKLEIVDDSQDSFEEDSLSSEPSSPYFNDPLGVNRAKRKNKHHEKRNFEMGPKAEMTEPTSPPKPQTKERSVTPSVQVTPQLKRCPICSLDFTSTESQEIATHVEDCVKKVRQSLLANRSPRAILATLTSSSLPNVISQTPIPITTPPNQPPDLRSSSFPPAPRTRQVPQSSFVIKCPYPNCSQSMEPWDFFSHATRLHKKDPQNFACPICAIQTGNYRVSSNTHLLNHLNRHHFEELNDSDSSKRSSMMESNESEEETFIFSTKLGSSYLEDTLKESTGTECTICFEEFLEGDKIARLECFCVFHKKCIDAWFRKKHKCPLHTD